jgi:hypothetical protein
MATPWVAATLYGASEREMFRLIERGGIHVTENERVLLCLKCVSRITAESINPLTDVLPIILLD